ncbi:hypothetical protein NDU88_007812 [Pleurodeles waltl]|uniref:Uncharacterized protein n=1 Tax=Pleurodeles waltl TaxID=8319 RepID=A0AAV7NXL7_PLEWA|nr:hypothetical protein NDU88_007812 [Pleurodeles waltl]
MATSSRRESRVDPAGPWPDPLRAQGSSNRRAQVQEVRDRQLVVEEEMGLGASAAKPFECIMDRSKPLAGSTPDVDSDRRPLLSANKQLVDAIIHKPSTVSRIESVDSSWRPVFLRVRSGSAVKFGNCGEDASAGEDTSCVSERDFSQTSSRRARLSGAASSLSASSERGWVRSSRDTKRRSESNSSRGAVP